MFIKIVYIVMFVLTSDLGDEQERKCCGLMVMRVCFLLRRGQVVLASFFVNLTKSIVIRQEGTSI